jgi:PAS domain S-box-containing protein
MPMGDDTFQTIAARDPRLARLATGPRPAWLWSTDGSRILWCNDDAAAALGIGEAHLIAKLRSPADPHGRQVAQLARRLASNGATRLERLRGFGARLGQLTTCACSRFETPDGEIAVLLVAMELSFRAASRGAPVAAAPAPADAIDPNDRILSEAVIDEPLVDATAPDAPIDEGISGPDLPSDTFALAEDVADVTPDANSDASAVADPTTPRLREEVGEPADDRTPMHSIGRGEPASGEKEPSEPDDAPASAGASTAPHKPLRFVWQIDAAGKFSLISDEFLRIAGQATASIQGRGWNEVAQALDLDPQGRIAQAIANRETWSRIAVRWPRAGSDQRARVELSGMPMFDSARNFAGYRGFGIYRHASAAVDDPDARQAEAAPVERPASDFSQDPISQDSMSAAATPAAPDNFSRAETEIVEPPPIVDPPIVEPPRNVLPFPVVNETRGPSLSAVENHAFDEIARRLTQQKPDLSAPRHETPAPAGAALSDQRDGLQDKEHVNPARPEQPAWLAAEATPARGDSTKDRMLLDLMPSGILIYRLDRLLYANRAFLERTAFENLHALQEAGGLDALYVEPGPTSASSTSDDGMPLKIAPSADDRAPSDARLFSIVWDGETAHALILQATPAASQALPAPPPPAPAPAPPADNNLAAILETATDGIVLFDRSGAIVSCNRSAEALFGLNAAEFRALNFAELFAPESQRVVLDYFESLDGPVAANPPDHGREVLGRERAGGFVPLSMTMGRNDATGERFFAVFRDLSPLKRNEQDLSNARRHAERATTAKTEALASISHEIRGPLNTIIGFANVMIEERFGGLGNGRYAEYLKDIRASGERAIAILDDIVNISSIETGSLDLKLVNQNLNEMVEQCVGVLQPQANRERVIIRTSLAHALPLVMADTQALRQITMNILSSSIRFSKAGGQVIVSTAPGSNGGAILRVRDAGRGLSETELATAMGSHRGTAAPSERTAIDRGTIDLSLARALAEANRAQFQIKTTENAGTLIEVTFATMRARAG